jgi:uncharacterized protein with PIN domain
MSLREALKHGLRCPWCKGRLRPFRHRQIAAHVHRMVVVRPDGTHVREKCPYHIGEADYGASLETRRRLGI